MPKRFLPVVVIAVAFSSAWAADPLAEMTVPEKTEMLYGDTLFTSPGVPKLGIPPLRMSDGPHAVREEQLPDRWGSARRNDDTSTYLPVGCALAATWNPAMARKHGEELGSEARARGKDIILGPAMNIVRTPLCGRSFEYFSEDPIVNGAIATEFVKGVQSQGTAACIKHFAANNQERDRFNVDSRVDVRTLRELYFPAFERAVREGGALTLMAAYNRLNGVFCTQDKWLLDDVLRKDWGFRGVVISDWNAVANAQEAAVGGLDLEMGLGPKHYATLAQLVADKRVPMATLDEHVRRHLYLRHALGMEAGQTRPVGSLNTPEHQQVAREIAEEAITLLKNEGGLLPLNFEKIRTLAVIGPNADRALGAGGNSSEAKPPYEVTALQGLRKVVAPGAEVLTSSGEDLHESLAQAKRADVVIFVGGLDKRFDTEGEDRPDMKLPPGQDALVAALAAANPRTVVCLFGSGPVEMDTWLAKVPALVQLWYPGMEGGNALAGILSGKVNPSGKLPVTIPRRLADSPAHALGTYPEKDGVADYKEGLLVGYRWFDKRNIEPQFPFGFGLGYTTFALSDLAVNREGDGAKVNVTVKNTGSRAGAEVVQIYVGPAEGDDGPGEPIRTLRAFDKITLQPGESRKVELKLDRRAFAHWDVKANEWAVTPGPRTIWAGTSSRDLPLKARISF
jgi:beta-glucosidase